MVDIHTFWCIVAGGAAEFAEEDSALLSGGFALGLVEAFESDDDWGLVGVDNGY